MPLSNAAAHSELAQRRIARNQAELNHRELLSRVTLEVRRTVADVVTGRQRIETSRVGEFAEENLRNQGKRHEVGMATTKDLLDFQTRLTSARAAEVAAKIDYAVARWRRAQGRLLDHYQSVRPAGQALPALVRAVLISGPIRRQAVRSPSASYERRPGAQRRSRSRRLSRFFRASARSGCNSSAFS
jgi:hypothetical protein